MDLQPGQIVHVRSRKYLVEGVVAPPEPTDSPLVRLSCVEDDALGEPLEVLWDKEIDAQVIDEANWQAIASRGFDEPRWFSAYLNTLRWNCVTSTNARLFQAPYRAGIEVKAFQLEPLRKALLMPRVNLFIADSVGLGKTIEAGLILREMLMRQKVRRTVICCPPSVVRQWKDEMEQRFGLTFMIYDRDYVTTKRQERGYGVNPWTTHSRFIISQALIRNETYAAPLRSWLEEFEGGSMFILDEAHNAAPASATKYAIDSKLTQAIRDLTPCFEHKLFLSATPHNGHSNSFSAILEMLDPQKFCRGVPVHRASRDAVMIRRLKHDLREIGEEFPERKIIRIDIEGLPEDAPELVLSHLLQRYRRTRETRLDDASASQRASAMLVVISLQKRLLSSIEAFARTLDVHRRAMKRQALEASALSVSGIRPETLSLLVSPPGSNDERAALAEEEVAAEDDAQMEAATAASAGTAHVMGPELELLDEMAHIANQARYEPDSRIRLLITWVKENLCPEIGTSGAGWNDRRVLIFTEYTDTKRYLVQQLEAAIAGSDQDHDRIMTFHGGIGEERREAIKAAFNADPARHPVRILVANGSSTALRATGAFSSPRRAASGAMSFSTGRWWSPPSRRRTRPSSPERLMSTLRRLGRPAIKGLAAALDGGRVAPPFHHSQLQGHVSDELVEGVLGELQYLSDSGMEPAHIAHMLRLLAEERAAAQAIVDRVALVWSGTEVMAGASRDTAVVVQELFREARESVLIASYALDTGSKAAALFGKLAERMDAERDLQVRLFVNVHRRHRDDTADAILLRKFADTFRAEIWPGERLPEVFHDPRSLTTDGPTRACLHAKCIVIDEDRALITSANFTEAAHERNIEAGTVITDTILSRALKAQFDTLVDHGALKRVPGL